MAEAVAHHPGIFPSLGPLPSIDESKKPPLADMAYLVGGVWTASITDPNGEVTEVKEWIEWAVEGWALSSFQVTTPASGQPVRACGVMCLDPCTGKLMMSKYGSSSTTDGLQGESGVLGDATMVFEGKTDVCTSVVEWRQNLVQTGEHEMVTVTEVKVEGEYQAQPPVTFTRTYPGKTG